MCSKWMQFNLTKRRRIPRKEQQRWFDCEIPQFHKEEETAHELVLPHLLIYYVLYLTEMGFEFIPRFSLNWNTDITKVG